MNLMKKFAGYSRSADEQALEDIREGEWVKR
jgi:hypothetical protein